MKKVLVLAILGLMVLGGGMVTLKMMPGQEFYYLTEKLPDVSGIKVIATYGDGYYLIKSESALPFKTLNYSLGFDSGFYYDVPRAKIGRYFIVQFAGPILPQWRDRLISGGYRIHEYIPNYAYLVEGDYRGIRALFANNPDVVRAIYPYMPEFKYDYMLWKTLKTSSRGDMEIVVELFHREDSMRLSSLFPNSQIIGNGKYVKIKGVSGEDVRKLAEMEIVKSISLYVPPKILNNFISRHFLHTAMAWHTWSSTLPANINGSAVVVVVLDTGLSDTTSDSDKNDPTKVHWDFFSKYTDLYINGGKPTGNSRVLAIRDVAGDGDTGDRYSGHGTHVSGMILGNGFMSGADPEHNKYYFSYAGGAPQARLIFQASEDGNNPDSISFDGVGGNFAGALDDALTTANNLGVTFNVHSNSWGSALDGDYGGNAHDADWFVWNHTWVLITVSAGNEGPGNQTIGDPASGKNVLSIGAAENYRPGHDPVEGITPLYVVDFSSRGPTLDGRIKPDVVGVGTWDISTRSSVASEGLYGPVEGNSNYEYCSGTSQSNPSVAGAATLVYDYFIKVKHLSPKEISAALVKAMLINGARDMGYGVPSYIQGWGRVDIENTLFPKPPRSFKYWQNTSGVKTGGDNITYINVASSDEPLKITLVWSDPGAAESANPSLVNDLDLKVTDPNGNVYYGNFFSNSWSVANPSGQNQWSSDNDPDDDLNNVENVFVANPTPGQWKIEVIGDNVPGNSISETKVQPFALVASGDFGRKDYDMRLSWKLNGKDVMESRIFDYVYPGVSKNFVFNITNYGTNDDTYTLQAVVPSDVSVNFDKSKVSVPAGSSVSVTATMQTTTTASPGLREVIIKATSENRSGGTEPVSDSYSYTYDSDSQGWIFHTWETDTDVGVSGSYQSSGGNPGGYLSTTISDTGAPKNAKGSGYWMKALNFYYTPTSVSISFDYSVIQYPDDGPVDFELYVETVSGAPATSPVWSTSESSATSWTSVGPIDLSSVITSPGTYYFKLVFRANDVDNREGPWEGGYDNVVINAQGERKIPPVMHGISVLLNVQGNQSFVPRKLTAQQLTEHSAYFPAIAQDKSNENRIFLAYIATDGSGVHQVYLIKSEDGGNTWSSPIQVSQSTTYYKDDLTISTDGRHVAIAWHEKDAIYKMISGTESDPIYWNMNREWIAIRVYDSQTNSFTSNVHRIKKEESWVYSGGIVTADLYDYNHMGYTPTVVIRSGRIWLFYQYVYLYSHYTYSIIGSGWQLSEQDIQIYVNSTYSDDYGVTWSSETELTGQVTNDAGNTVDRGYHPYAFVDSSGKLWLFYYKLDTNVKMRDIYYMTYDGSWGSETALEPYSDSGKYQDVLPYAYEDKYGKIWVVWWSNRTGELYTPILKYYDGNSWSSPIEPFTSVSPKPVIDLYNNYYSPQKIPMIIQDSRGVLWLPYPVAENYSTSRMTQLYTIFSSDNFTTVQVMPLTESYYGSTWPVMYRHGKNVVFVFPQANATWRTNLVKIEVSNYFEMSLQPGWNLVSNPLYNNKLYASMLDRYLSSGDEVSLYNPGNGYTDRLIGVTGSPNFHIPWYSGFWVYNSGSTTKNIRFYGLIYSGKVHIDLHQGWNLIGLQGLVSLNASELPQYVTGGNVKVISIWDANAQEYKDYIVGISSSSYDFTISPGMGVWIYVDSDCYLEYTV